MIVTLTIVSVITNSQWQSIKVNTAPHYACNKVSTADLQYSKNGRQPSCSGFSTQIMTTDKWSYYVRFVSNITDILYFKCTQVQICANWLWWVTTMNTTIIQLQCDTLGGNHCAKKLLEIIWQ